MKDWQVRVMNERDNLNDNIEKLENFLDNTDDSFDMKSRDLLKCQLLVMQQYSAILDMRILDF